jgi:hypothetical protein
MSDLTIIYYTANVVPEPFAEGIRNQILTAAPDMPIVSVSHKPIRFGQNIVVNLPRHHLSIYRQALLGAKEARTRYIVLCEDDVLYSPEHFKHRPHQDVFAYNIGHWGLYTWEQKPVFSWKGRRTLGNLICERDLFIHAMEERFKRWPDDNEVDLSVWAEPGKYERQLDVSTRQTEEFWTNPPNIVFSHQTALAFENLGKRKRLGELRATKIPYWGSANKLRSLYP